MNADEKKAEEIVFGMFPEKPPKHTDNWFVEKIAAALRAEREACAKVAEEKGLCFFTSQNVEHTDLILRVREYQRKEIAVAIRKRGEL